MIRLVISLFLLLLTPAFGAKLSWVEQIPIESYSRMREVERYQLKIAEKHYLGGEYKIALDEYEKFLTLYETSAGAPYAQLMWSHCLVRLRKVNTAIREGFQSVIDYWPGSDEAVLASYLIGTSLQDIGEVEKAKATYRALMEDHPEGVIPGLAKVKLLEMAKVAQDEEERLQLLEELTYGTNRIEALKHPCEAASRELASLLFHQGATTDALKALETTYRDGSLDHHAYEYGRQGIQHLRRDEKTRRQGDSLARWLVSFFEKRIPSDLGSDGGNRNYARDQFSRIAGVYQTLGEQAEVLKTYERIGKVLGSDDRLLGQIAGYHRSIGERDQAKTVYRRMENQVEARRHLAWMFREERKYDEAIESYRGLVEADPNRIDEYLWVVAECYEGKSDWKNAVQTYRQVDRWPQTNFRMASCHRRLKQHKEAMGLYQQAKAHEPSAPEAALQLAYTYEEAGQKENAIKAFQLTCRSYPKSGQASRAHAHLQTNYDINMTLGGAKDE